MTAAILFSDQLDLAVAELLAGGVVGMPTETVYGLAGDATNPAAIAKIFATKERPHFDPLIVHVPAHWNSVDLLHQNRVVDSTKMSAGQSALVTALIKAFWPGPLTLLLPRHAAIPDLVTSGLSTVGVRMPSHPVAQALLAAVKTPLAAPSANRFGRISPTTAQHVASELGDRIPYIIDGGPCAVGVESTVVAVHDGSVSVLRPGKISIRDLESVVSPLGARVERAATVLDDQQSAAQASPGTLASHYAPQKPLFLLQNSSAAELARIPLSLHARTVGVLLISADDTSFVTGLKNAGIIVQAVKSLSTTGEPAEAAQQLFSAMRLLDESDAGIILCENVKNDDGLWYAISDRLMRASQKII